MKLFSRKYKLSNNGFIDLDRTALHEMLAYRQKAKNNLEAGGVHLGRFILDSKNIVVDEVTKPFSSDIRERRRFKRGLEHQKVIDEKWRLSDGKTNYLGEWHTHPENHPEPSRQDIREWKKILKNDVFSSRYLYFVIVGVKDLKIWEGDRRTLKIKELTYE